ncbi:hypothetical protein RRG08_009512 [Elysia crispata]|uniref:Uncharacterized protein n=1 Tax=Elysia crispata TaxID=231223 RepID=A0AAE1B2X5_9GAST|nr:hypothetical protein RRG08_009512 [Elysia crispata]
MLSPASIVRADGRMHNSQVRQAQAASTLSLFVYWEEFFALVPGPYILSGAPPGEGFQYLEEPCSAQVCRQDGSSLRSEVKAVYEASGKIINRKLRHRSPARWSFRSPRESDGHNHMPATGQQSGITATSVMFCYGTGTAGTSAPLLKIFFITHFPFPFGIAIRPQHFSPHGVYLVKRMISHATI